MNVFFQVWKKHIVSGVLLMLITLNTIVWGSAWSEAHVSDMTIQFFDVGQGDSIFLESKDGTQILIDGGPNGNVLSRLGAVMPFYDHSIDVIILTHPHADHVTGLLAVLDRYHVGMVIESGASYHTSEALAFLRAAQNQHIPRVVIDHPQILRFGDGAELKLLAPTHSFEHVILKNVHDAMIVGLLSYHDKKILLMGDAEKNIEHTLAQEGRVYDIDILKAGHHGSKTSSIAEFLLAAKPKYAIISVGRNRYGHPNQDVLTRFAATGAHLFRTDRDGTITAQIRGSELSVVSEK